MARDSSMAARVSALGTLSSRGECLIFDYLRGEDVVVIGAAQRGPVAAVADDQRHMNARFPARPGRDLVVQIAGGVGEGGEHQQLAVGTAIPVAGRLPDLVLDQLADNR